MMLTNIIQYLLKNENVLKCTMQTETKLFRNTSGHVCAKELALLSNHSAVNLNENKIILVQVRKHQS